MEITEQRYNGLTDQIDFYINLSQEIELSNEQVKQLKELRDTIIVFGKRAKKWVKLVNEILSLY